MVNVGPLSAQIGWRVLGTQENFNGFRVLASLLHGRCSTEVNQILHHVWPSPWLVYHIYILGGSCPLMEFYQVQNSLCIQVLHASILEALLHSTRAVCVRQPNFAACDKEGNYGTFTPPPIFRTAHILVLYDSSNLTINVKFNTRYTKCKQQLDYLLSAKTQQLCRPQL